jgi:hypothetical protein
MYLRLATVHKFCLYFFVKRKFSISKLKDHTKVYKKSKKGWIDHGLKLE